MRSERNTGSVCSRGKSLIMEQQSFRNSFNGSFAIIFNRTRKRKRNSPETNVKNFLLIVKRFSRV
jgi:hypothetical protein